MKKTTELTELDEDASELSKSAYMFRKLSKCIKAQNTEQIDKALDKVEQHIRLENKSQMKTNLKQLKRLLDHKKNMLDTRGRFSFKKQNPILSIEASSPYTKNQKIPVKVHRKFRLNKENYFSQEVSFPQKKNITMQKNNKTINYQEARSKRRINTVKSTKSKSYKSSNRQHLKTFMNNKQRLKDLIDQFQTNPRAITPSHLQVYHSAKREFLSSTLNQSQYNILKSSKELTRVRTKKQLKKPGDIDKIGTDIQNIINECSEVLECHYINLDKQEQAQFIRRHRETPLRLRNTLNIKNSVSEKNSKYKPARHGLRRMGPRKTAEQFYKNCSMNTDFSFEGFSKDG